MSSLDKAKRLAAERAADFVRDGMRLGLGTGSTAAHFVDCIGEKVARGMTFTCVPTSEATRRQAERLGITLSTLDETPELDLTVDGADEFDPQLRLIKGGGGALLREKIVAFASRRMIVITDATKKVATLGRFPLPVEVVPFGLEATRRALVALFADMELQGTISLRKDAGGHAFVTDGAHSIFDCALNVIADPDRLAERLKTVPGVVEHGLFLGLADAVIVAGESGLEIIGNPGA